MVVPKGWSRRLWKDIASFQRGYDLPNRDFVKGIYPVVCSNGVIGYHNQFIANGPGVVTGRSGTIGKVHFIPLNFWPHNTSLWITDFHGNDPKYIYYLLSTLDLAAIATGSGVPTLNRNDIYSFTKLVPRVPEQKSIAAALSDMDELIDALESLIEKKKAIKQGAMQELLTGRKQSQKFDGKWKITTLGKLLQISHGKNQANIESKYGKYPILATGGVIGKTDMFLYDKESVLIGRKGTINRPLYMNIPFWTIDTLFYTVLSDEVYAKFIYYLFCSINWELHNEASGVPSLSAKTISDIVVKIPDIKENKPLLKSFLIWTTK